MCHSPGCLDDVSRRTCYPPSMSADVRAIARDVVRVDERCTTQCLRGNVAECVCYPPFDGHYKRDVVPVTCPERRKLADDLFQEAIDNARQLSTKYQGD